MTEYELLDLMGSTIDSMGDCFTIYLSIVSGFLVVAYFIGNKLTAVQAVIVVVLFIFSAGLQVWGIHEYQIAVQELLTRKAELSPLTNYQDTVLNNNGGTIFAILMACGIVASLYFMWSIRHPREESLL